MRAVLLDEVALEDQRLDLRARQDELEVRDMGDHRAHLRRMVLVLLEILPHAVLQHDGLADVDDLAFRVLHDVDARMIRQQLQFLLDDLGHALTSMGYYTILSLTFHGKGDTMSTEYFSSR